VDEVQKVERQATHFGRPQCEACSVRQDLEGDKLQGNREHGDMARSWDMLLQQAIFTSRLPDKAGPERDNHEGGEGRGADSAPRSEVAKHIHCCDSAPPCRYLPVGYTQRVLGWRETTRSEESPDCTRSRESRPENDYPDELLVGYDDGVAHGQDTGCEEVQRIPLEELQMAWDVSVPGLGRRNRLVILDIPDELPPTDTRICRAIADQCQAMLSPPVSMVGTPAMEKVAREMAHSPDALGEPTAAKYLRQVREHLNSAPDLEGDRPNAGRHLYVKFLEEAGAPS